MTEERSYTTKIWRQPSSIGFSSADALSTSMDPPGEPVISTRKRPCQKIQNGSEFPELVAQNFRNPHDAIGSLRPLVRWGFYACNGQVSWLAQTCQKPLFGAHISSGIFFTGSTPFCRKAWTTDLALKRGF